MNRYVVYKITNLKNRKFYIGSTSNFLARKAEHFGQLRTNTHCNKDLQKDFNIYGESYFVMEVLDDGFRSRQEMMWREYSLILSTFKDNYNVDTTCPIDTRGKGNLNHKQFKKKFHVSNINIKANAKLERQREERLKNKMSHPYLDEVAERKKRRDDIANQRNSSNDY